jgi:hypothetical protein
VEKLPHNYKRYKNHPCRFHCYCNYVFEKKTAGIAFVPPLVTVWERDINFGDEQIVYMSPLLLTQ